MRMQIFLRITAFPKILETMKKNPKIKLAKWRLIEIIFLDRFPHPDEYSCEIDQSFADPCLKISIFSIYMSHWVWRGGHMNTYPGGGTSQGKIIPIKRHFASLIFGIVSPLVGFGLPDKYSYETSKPKLVYIWNNIYHINTYSQHTIYKDMHKVTSLIKSSQNYYLSLVYCKISRTSLHLPIQLPWQFC